MKKKFNSQFAIRNSLVPVLGSVAFALSATAVHAQQVGVSTIETFQTVTIPEVQMQSQCSNSGGSQITFGGTTVFSGSKKVRLVMSHPGRKKTDPWTVADTVTLDVTRSTNTPFEKGGGLGSESVGGNPYFYFGWGTEQQAYLGRCVDSSSGSVSGGTSFTLPGTTGLARGLATTRVRGNSCAAGSSDLTVAVEHRSGVQGSSLPQGTLHVVNQRTIDATKSDTDVANLTLTPTNGSMRLSKEGRRTVGGNPYITIEWLSPNPNGGIVIPELIADSSGKQPGTEGYTTTTQDVKYSADSSQPLGRCSDLTKVNID